MTRTRVDTCFLLFALSILIVSTIYATPAMDEDIWWHLRTGSEILARHGVPVKDTFSWHAMGQPWIAYSWLFDVFVACVFRSFGYRGILTMINFMALASTAWMIVFLAHLTNLRRGMILAFCAYIAMMPLKSPRPWLFTVLFFIVEISCLWMARERTRPAWLLPLVPLFVLWANVHIQFVYGLALIGLFAVDLSVPDSWREKLSMETHPGLRSRWLWMLLAACSLSTLVNPYGWNLYRVVVQYATQRAPMTYVSEMQALPFRLPSHWFSLALIGAAVFVMGGQRKKSLLLILGLIFSCYSGFRSQRDIWFPVTFAVVAIAAGIRTAPRAEREGSGVVYGAAIPLSFAIILLSIAFNGSLSESSLDKKVGDQFPVKAAAYVQTHGLEGPLFNSYNWGGYLIWRLPAMPVSIDNRANLYEDSLAQAAKTTTGRDSWTQDPDLKKARTILLEHDSALASILRVDPRFRVAYEDKVASVFQPVGP